MSGSEYECSEPEESSDEEYIEPLEEENDFDNLFTFEGLELLTTKENQ